MSNKFFKGLLISTFAATALFSADVSLTKNVDTNVFKWTQVVPQTIDGARAIKFPVRVPLTAFAGQTVHLINLFGGVTVDGQNDSKTTVTLENGTVVGDVSEDILNSFFAKNNAGDLYLKGNHTYAISSEAEAINLVLYVNTPVGSTETGCTTETTVALTVVDDKGIPQVPGPANDATASVNGDNVTITFIEDILLAKSGETPDALTGDLTQDGSSVTFSKDVKFVKLMGANGTTAIYEIALEETSNCPDETPIECPVEEPDYEAYISDNGYITIEECPAAEEPDYEAYISMNGYITAEECPVADLTDSDADGILDVNDTCADTPADSFVNSSGCTQAQLDGTDESPVIDEPIEVNEYSEYDTTAVDGAGNAIDSASLGSYEVNVYTKAEDDLTGQNGKVIPVKAILDGETVNLFVNEGYVGVTAVVKLMDGDTVVGAVETELVSGLNEVELSASEETTTSTDPVALEDNLDYVTSAVNGAGNALDDIEIGSYNVNVYSLAADDLAGENGKVVPLKVTIGDDTGMIFVNEGYSSKTLVVKVYLDGALVNLSDETEVAASGLTEITID